MRIEDIIPGKTRVVCDDYDYGVGVVTRADGPYLMIQFDRSRSLFPAVGIHVEDVQAATDPA